MANGNAGRCTDDSDHAAAFLSTTSKHVSSFKRYDLKYNKTSVISELLAGILENVFQHDRVAVV